MTHAFRRSPAQHRPTLRPAPGMGAYEVDSTIEAAEADFDEDDWIQWEDAADVFDGPLPGEPFARHGA